MQASDLACSLVNNEPIFPDEIMIHILYQLSVRELAKLFMKAPFLYLTYVGLNNSKFWRDYAFEKYNIKTKTKNIQNLCYTLDKLVTSHDYTSFPDVDANDEGFWLQYLERYYQINKNIIDQVQTICKIPYKDLTYQIYRYVNFHFERKTLLMFPFTEIFTDDFIEDLSINLKTLNDTGGSITHRDGEDYYYDNEFNSALPEGETTLTVNNILLCELLYQTRPSDNDFLSTQDDESCIVLTPKDLNMDQKSFQSTSDQLNLLHDKLYGWMYYKNQEGDEDLVSITLKELRNNTEFLNMIYAKLAQFLKSRQCLYISPIGLVRINYDCRCFEMTICQDKPFSRMSFVLGFFEVHIQEHVELKEYIENIHKMLFIRDGIIDEYMKK